MRKASAVSLALAAVSLAITSTGFAAGFRFESVVALQDMRSLLTRTAPLGTPRAALRAMFLEEGGGTLHVHPERAGIEKYVYDINLCRLYVWRWNVSANYDAGGGLTQIFVNGEPVHPRGDKELEPPSGGRPGVKQTISKAWRARPEASLGEKQLAFMLYDLDKASDRVDDEFVVGGGPTRADPRDLGTLHGYTGERWRSIFDAEPAKTIVDYAGTCPR